MRLLRTSPLFDERWYLAQNPDVSAASIDPALHYLLHGAAEGRDPGPHFQTREYLARYPDVRSAGQNPLVHYLKRGRVEGRLAEPVASRSAWRTPPAVRASTPTDLVIYTAIFGDSDTLKAPTVITPGCRYICFSDFAVESDVWDVVKPQRQYADPRRESRFYKLRPHRYFDCRYSLWVDGSVRIHSDLRDLVDRYLQDADVAAFAHPQRDSIYDEADACVRLGLDNESHIRDQMARYRRAGLPEHAGLVEAGFLLRRHTSTVAALNETWWQEYEAGSTRDQLSFNFSAWKLGIAYHTIPGNIRETAELELTPHRRGTWPTPTGPHPPAAGALPEGGE